jgi:hypothetical protein
MPFGSGMGTFVPVYGIFEEPQHVLVDTYANHAHNDFLELWLETGIFGVGIFLAFAVWFVSRSLKIWRAEPTGVRRIDVLLARAATVVIVLVAAHSVADYPLRTAAIMAVFAFACALLVEPLDRTEKLERDSAIAAKLGSPQPRMSAALPATLPPQPGGRWGEDIDWPQEWSKTETQKSAAVVDTPPGESSESSDK